MNVAILALASGLAQTPYSFDDGIKICARHERYVESTQEGVATHFQHAWDSGFAYCDDLREWAAKAANDTRQRDLKIIKEMEKALGPFPESEKPRHPN